MQNRHASASPVQLEDLLQVPLQVVRLEDLIREKASSVSPPQSTNPNNDGADGRLCRSADSQVPKPSDSSRANDDSTPKLSSSAPCLFDCCIKPTTGDYGGEKLARDVRFKTAALNLPDGSSVVVPVVDFDQDGRHQKNVLGHSKHVSAEDNDSDRTTSASPPHLESVTPPPLPPQSAPVVLGTVTEEPTRYEDFLLTHGCKISHNSIVGENRLQRNGSSKGIPQKTVGDTLELTFYNDGRKESEREYRPHLKEQDVRYFENQQLQLSRVIRDPGPVQQHVENRSHFNNTHPPRHKPHGSNNTISKIFAQPQLELTSSIINNLNKNSIVNRLNTTNNSHDSNGKTWEQLGLKISRCQKDEQQLIPVDDECNGEKVPEKRMALGGELREKGEAEILIERHLQAYLTSLKYVKPGSEEHPTKVDIPVHRGRSITHGLSGLAPQPSRVHSPCEPAQITRIPNVRPPASSPASGHQQQQHHLEAWPERTIARIPARPYLRRNISEEQPQLHQMYPPPKRFRGNNVVAQPIRQIFPRQQGLNNQQHITSPHQHPQYHNNAQSSAISNGGGDTNPAIRSQQNNCANLRQQLQHTAAYHASSTVPSPQHSPIAHAHAQQQYHHHPVQQQQQQQKYPNNASQQQTQLQEARMLVAAVAGNGGEGSENNAYVERLRRYWDYYQRQELDWVKLTEYYQKYHFYPWDILSARDETIRQWRQQQQQQYATHPQLHAQLTQNSLQGGDGRPIDVDNLTQQQQHQLALRAMNIAAANYANSKSQYSTEISSPTSVSIQNRIVGMDVSPPSTSPLPPQVQNKYNHNSQQLQQLQQYHQRHLSLQQQQQQQHNQQQRLRFNQEQHHQHQQQQQQQLQQQKAQQVVLMANQKLQNSVNYYSAYNQLAAAAAAIASTVSNPQNKSRSSSAMEKNCPPIVILDEEKEPEPEDIPIPVTTHRQTLELAMKNNFRNRSNSAGNGTINSAFVNQYPHRNHVDRVRKDISTTPQQSQPASTTVSAHHLQQRSSWPKTGNGAINMTKESQKTTASSPNSSVQQSTSVIRRLRIIQPKPPPSYTSPSSNSTAQQRNSNATRTSMQNSGDNNDTMAPIPLVLHKNRHYAREYGNNSDGNANRREVESNAATNRNSADENNRNPHNQQHSPIPMVAGEEEVITSVSPSAVLSNYDDMPDDEGGDDKDAYNSSGTPEPGGVWQYDHVVLLDKRIKTYMCKRCFETLKTEQQIRNHLFCKMLANHVQCHVCLQLFTSDAYPAHLQIHGVRPLEDAGSDE